jgi:hypothetical protein
VTHQRTRRRQSPWDDREELAELLRFAFPLGHGGSFTGVLEAIRTARAEDLDDPFATRTPAEVVRDPSKAEL